MERPKIGVGVIIQAPDQKILIGKRKGSHAPYYSIPGGHLENGETFEEAAMKEVLEETGLHIYNPKLICLTNNLRTYQETNKHYVSAILYTNEYSGKVEVKKKDKCEGWEWYAVQDIPQPHFDASEFAIECFVNDAFYIPGQR